MPCSLIYDLMILLKRFVEKIVFRIKTFLCYCLLCFSSFDEARLTPLLRQNVANMGYALPTAVQKYCIPIVGRGYDLMACAQTGSGKTVRFCCIFFGSKRLTNE